MASTHPVSLKQLAESKAVGIQKTSIVFKVDPDLVEFEENFNLRDPYDPELSEHIERLYVAMKAGSYVPPIDVRIVDGRIIARDGHCRTTVARRLKAEGVDYVLEARQIKGDEASDVYHMLGSNQGRAFTPLEQGRGFKRLVSYGQDIGKIAARTGLHRSTIENAIALAETPVKVQQLVASGKVSGSLALKTVRVEGAATAPKLLAAAVAKAEASGKTKATGKHLNGPKVRGQTLPPPAIALPISAGMWDIVQRVAKVDVNDRITLGLIIADAKKLAAP